MLTERKAASWQSSLTTADATLQLTYEAWFPFCWNANSTNLVVKKIDNQHIKEIYQVQRKAGVCGDDDTISTLLYGFHCSVFACSLGLFYFVLWFYGYQLKSARIKSGDAFLGILGRGRRILILPRHGFQRTRANFIMPQTITEIFQAYCHRNFDLSGLHLLPDVPLLQNPLTKNALTRSRLPPMFS